MAYDQSGNWVDDVNDYLKKNPNASDEELFKKFPKLGNKAETLHSVMAYGQDKESGSSSDDLDKRLPEFAVAKPAMVKPGFIPENQDPIQIAKKQHLQNIDNFGPGSINKLTHHANLNKQYAIQGVSAQGQDATYNRINIPDFRAKNEVTASSDEFKKDLAGNAGKQNQVVSQMVQDNPETAGDAYLATRTGGDVGVQVANKKKIESGEYTYNPQTNKLKKPLDLHESFLHGYAQRNKSLANYDFLDKASDDEIAKDQAEKMKANDPDKAIPTPAGTKVDFLSQLLLQLLLQHVQDHLVDYRYILLCLICFGLQLYRNHQFLLDCLPLNVLPNLYGNHLDKRW